MNMLTEEQETPDISEFEHVQIRKSEHGIQTVIALHSSVLGKPLGGCRIKSYRDGQDQINDTLRLAQGMTYKNAITKIPYGGGKMTVNLPEWANPNDDVIVDAITDSLNHLKQPYITAKDMGTTSEILKRVSTGTYQYVAGLSEGDPSSMTAFGVYCGIVAGICAKYCMDLDVFDLNPNGTDKSLEQFRIGVEGVGGVGSILCEILHNKGAKLFVYDYNPENYRKLDEKNIPFVSLLSPGYILKRCEIYSPCALGGISKNFYGRCNNNIVAGAANNQLYVSTDSEFLRQNRIYYCPDFVINAGGVINIACGMNPTLGTDIADDRFDEYGLEVPPSSTLRARAMTSGLSKTLLEMFKRSEEEGIDTQTIAIQMAKEIIEESS